MEFRWHHLLPVLLFLVGARAHYIQDSKNETISSQEGGGTCLYNGTWFGEGAELPTRGLCLVCRCFPGFVEPNAFSCSVIDCPWDDYHRRFPGCTPIYADRDCCPIGWECDYGTQNPGQQVSKGVDCDCEWRYLRHYEAKGCRPVYEEKPPVDDKACTCPWRFDCSQADDLKPDDKVCLFKKHVYPLGSRIPSSNPCEVCSCATDYFTQAAAIQCTTTECPAVYAQTPLPEGCHYVYEQNKCCPSSVHCPTTKKDDIYQVPLCEYKGKMYYEGEQIYPEEDPCLICLCDGNWTGGLNSSSCRQHDCMLERDARKLRQGCIPIYHEKTCCPIDYHCADDDFNFKNNRGASFKSDDDEDSMCFFESRYYPIGHVLDIQHPSHCVTCTCKTPPDFTCIHSSCPPPPNGDYANCRAVYKPHSCCPDYTCEEKKGASCPDPICRGTNCWLVKDKEGCPACRCKSRCIPCPSMCKPENPLNECSGCICQISKGTALYGTENSKSEEKPKEESQTNSLQQLIQECKKKECSSDERCMLVETKCDQEPCLPVPKCEKVAFGCGQTVCPEGCEEIGSYENNCPLCFCKQQIKEPQYKLTCKVQSCEENCILTGRDDDGCPVCKCPQGNLEERACAESPCSGFNCSMAVNSFGCAECRCQLPCKPRECPAGCELDLNFTQDDRGLYCGCQCANSSAAMEMFQTPVEGCSPATCQGFNCTVFEDKSGCPACSCKVPCPTPMCQKGCKVEPNVTDPGRCPGCVCKLSRSARDNTGKECPPPTCLGYNCSVITAENGCQKCLCESPCEEAPQCPSHCRLETNVPEGRCRGCVCSYGENASDPKRGGGKIPGEEESSDDLEPEKREDVDADFIPLPDHRDGLVPEVLLLHGGDLGEPLESGLYELEDSESRLPDEAREEGDYHYDYADESRADDDEDDKCAQKNCPEGQKCVIRRLQCIRTPCPAIPVCIDTEPRCPIPMCAIGCMVMKWDDEVCPSCFCGIIRGAEGRVCPRTRCVGKRCYNVIGDDGCPQCKCDSICIPPKCFDGCFVEKDPPAGKCPTCTCPDRGSVMQPIIPETTTTTAPSAYTNATEAGTTSENVEVRPTPSIEDDIQGRNPVLHGAPDPTLIEHDSMAGVDFYNSLAEIEEEVKSGGGDGDDLTTVTVNLPTTIDASDIFDTTTSVSETVGTTTTTTTEGTTVPEEVTSSTVALKFEEDMPTTTKKPCLLKPNATDEEEEVEKPEEEVEEIITEKNAAGIDHHKTDAHPTVIFSEHEPPSTPSTRRPQRRPTPLSKHKPKPQQQQQVPNAQSADLPPPEQDDSMKPILQNLQHLISNLHQVLATHQRPSEAANPSDAKPSAEDLQESESEKVQQNSTQESAQGHPIKNQQAVPPMIHQGVNPPYPVYSQYPYANPAMGLIPPQVQFQNHLQSIYANAAQNPLFGNQQQQPFYQQPTFMAPYTPAEGTYDPAQKQQVLLTNIPIPPSLQQQLIAGTQTLGFLQHLLNHRNNPYYQQQLVNMQQQHLTSSSEQKDPPSQQVVFSSHQPPQQQQTLEQVSSSTEQNQVESTTPQAMPEFPVVLDGSSSDAQQQVVQSIPAVNVQFNHHAPQGQQNAANIQSNAVENSQEQQMNSQQDQLEALAQQYQQLQEQMNQVQASQQGYISTDLSSQERPLQQNSGMEQSFVQYVQEQPAVQFTSEEIISNQGKPVVQGDVVNFSSQQQQIGQVHSSGPAVYEKPVENQQNELHISDKPILQAQPGYQSVFSNHNIEVQPIIQTNQAPMQQNVANIDDSPRPVLQGQQSFENSASQENSVQQVFQQTQQAPSQFLNQQAQQHTEQQYQISQTKPEQHYQISQTKPEQHYQVSQNKPEQLQDNIPPIIVSLEQTSQPAQQTFQSPNSLNSNQQQYVPLERPVYHQIQQQQPINVPNAQQAYQPVTIPDPSGITSPFSNQVLQQPFMNQNINQQVYQPPQISAQAQPVAVPTIQDKDQSGQQNAMPQSSFAHQHSQVQYVSNENEVPVSSEVFSSQQQQTQYRPVAEQPTIPQQQQYLQQNLQQQQQPSLPFVQPVDVNIPNTPSMQQQQQYLGIHAQQPSQVYDAVQNQQYQQQQFIHPTPVQTQAQQFHQQQFVSQEKPIVQAYQPPPIQPEQTIPVQQQYQHSNQQHFISQEKPLVQAAYQPLPPQTQPEKQPVSPPIQQQYQQPNQQQYINQQQNYNQQPQYVNQQFAYQQPYYNQQQQQYIQQQYYNPNQRPPMEAQQQYNQPQQQYQNQAPATFQQYEQQFMSNQPQVALQQTYQQQQEQIQPNQAYLPPDSNDEDPNAYVEDTAAQQDHFEEDLQQQSTSQDEDEHQLHIEDQVVEEPHFGEDDPQEEEEAPVEEEEEHEEEEAIQEHIQDVNQEHVEDKFSALQPLAQVVTGGTTEDESVLDSVSVKQVVENLKTNHTVYDLPQTTPLEPVQQSSGIKSRPGVIYRPHFTTPSPTTPVPTPDPSHDLFPAPSRPLSVKPTLTQEDYLDQQEDAPLDEEEEFDYDDFDLPESTTLSPPTPLVLTNFDNHKPYDQQQQHAYNKQQQQHVDQQQQHQQVHIDQEQQHQQEHVDDHQQVHVDALSSTTSKPPPVFAVSPTELYATGNKHPYQCPTPHCNGYNCSLIRGSDGCQKCVCDSPCAPCPQHCTKTKTVNEGRCPVCDCTGPTQLALPVPTRQCPVANCQGANCRQVKDAEGCLTCICDPKCAEPQCDPGCEVLRDVPPGQCPGCVCRVTVVQAVVQKPCKPVSCGQGCDQTNGPDGCPTCVCRKSPCPTPKCDPGCRVESDVESGTCPTCVCSSAYLEDEDDDDDDDDLYCPNLFCSEYGCREVPGPAGCPICMCDPICKTPVCDPGCEVVSNKYHGRCPVCICSNPVDGNITQQQQHQQQQTVQQQHPQQQQESVTFSGLAVEAVVAEEEEEEDEETTEASTLHTTVTVPLLETTTAATCPPPVCSGLRCNTETDENGCQVCKCRYKCPAPKCVGSCVPETNAPAHRCPGCVCPKKKPTRY